MLYRVYKKTAGNVLQSGQENKVGNVLQTAQEDSM